MNLIMLFVGVILMGAGVIAYIAIGGQDPAGIEGLPKGMDPGQVMKIVQYSVGGLLVGLGGLFSLGAFIGMVRRTGQRQLAARLMQVGIEAEGTVRFVDKNFRVLVNNIPIYSIVEYTYQDSDGNTHTRRIDNLNSELVTRSGIQVGSKILVKYAREAPHKSVMVFNQ